MNKLPFLRHPISFAGALITTMSAILFIVFFAVESMGMHTNPYMGMVFFLILPMFFIVGLLLIPFGMWRQRKRVAAGKADVQWPTLNLNSPRHRQVTAIGAGADVRERDHRVAGRVFRGALHGLHRVLRHGLP